MNLRSLIDQAINLAHSAGNVLPMVEGAGTVLQDIANVVEGLKAHAPDGQSADQLEAAHQALLKKALDSGHDLSARLRGG